MSILTSSLFLTGCAGGDGDAITIVGDGQSPDPVVVEVAIAYVKRPVPANPDDLLDPLLFNPGAQLFIKDRASNSAVETDITPQIAAIVAAELGTSVNQLEIDIKDLSVSYDGKILLFAARVVRQPVNANLDLTTWNLWQYEFETGTASYVLSDQIKRNEGLSYGGGHDIAPHFLPDDRIVFSSTRQSGVQSRNLDEGRVLYAGLDERRNGPAAVLHTLDPRDDSIEQISFNQSHDLDPSVMDDGSVVFSRWDNSTANRNRGVSLYKISPNGRQLSRLYGYHSHDTGSAGSTVHFFQAHVMENGSLLALLRETSSDQFGGNLVTIDTDRFADHDQPTWLNAGLGGSGQSQLTNTVIETDGSRSPGGQFSAAFPLHDGTDRLLLSWSPCRVIDNGLFVPCVTGPANAAVAPPIYGLWMYDPNDNTQRPITTAEEGFILTEVVAAEPRLRFPANADDSLITDSRLNNDEALLIIDSVYNLDGVDSSPSTIGAHANPILPEYANRPARFLRLIKPVPVPDDDVRDIDNSAYGASTAQLMREIVGYVPVEPDGSVTVKVPADTPLMISVLDARGRRLSERHDVWIQLGKQEVLRCTGCHTGNSELPHGRIDAPAPSANPGAQSLVGGIIGFINTPIDLFGSSLGDTMADIYDARRPVANDQDIERSLSLDLFYTDEWTDVAGGLTAEADIDLRYDAAWPAAETPIASSAGTLPDRIVVNYVDHIQPIWERTRVMQNGGVDVTDPAGATATNCIACHRSNPANDPLEIAVPAGQLDLTSHLDVDHYRSYRELFFTDTERWLNGAGNAADRVRSCTQDVDDGMGGTITVPVADPNPPLVTPTMRTAGANNSNAFFRCFEGGVNCGAFNQQATPPVDCTETGTIVTDAVAWDHNGWLSDAELRLISEWLDIGGQYYNNPFHPNLDP